MTFDVFVAISRNSYNQIHIALKNDFPVETRNMASGNTLLIEAAELGVVHIVELLLQFGANRDACNRKGDSAATVARKKQYLNVINILNRRC